MPHLNAKAGPEYSIEEGRGATPSKSVSTIFETKRLQVRPLRQADIYDFHEMQGDDEVMRYTVGDGNDGAGLSLAQNQKQLEQCMARYDEPGNNFWVWAIVDESQHWIGTCAVVVNDRGENEIGYRLRRAFWGRGYGREVACALIQHAIQEMDLPEIVAYVDIRNQASVRILDQSQLSFVEETTDSHGVIDRKYVWRP